MATVLPSTKFCGAPPPPTNNRITEVAINYSSF